MGNRRSILRTVAMGSALGGIGVLSAGVGFEGTFVYRNIIEPSFANIHEEIAYLSRTIQYGYYAIASVLAGAGLTLTSVLSTIIYERVDNNYKVDNRAIRS